MEAIFVIIVILALLYLAYKVILFVSKNNISADIKTDTSKFTIKIKDWFVWNVQINNEKGTAGGNIKINFPIKSGLLLAVVCMVIAIVFHSIGVSLVVSLVFISFAVFHFRKWVKSLKFLSAHEAFENVKNLTRSDNKAIIGGVCSGIAKQYNSSPALIRFVFFLFALGFGIGIYIYILLWAILPMEKQS